MDSKVQFELRDRGTRAGSGEHSDYRRNLMCGVHISGHTVCKAQGTMALVDLLGYYPVMHMLCAKWKAQCGLTINRSQFEVYNVETGEFLRPSGTLHSSSILPDCLVHTVDFRIRLSVYS